MKAGHGFQAKKGLHGIIKCSPRLFRSGPGQITQVKIGTFTALIVIPFDLTE